MNDIKRRIKKKDVDEGRNAQVNDKQEDEDAESQTWCEFLIKKNDEKNRLKRNEEIVYLQENWDEDTWFITSDKTTDTELNPSLLQISLFV